MAGLTLQSMAFADNAPLPGDYSREGGDLSPPLEWSGVPDEATELVLVCDDPDAPVGSFTHWLLAGIPPDAEETGPGEEPAGAVAGRNDYGGLGYGGPHPPPGDPPHRYFFRLYALAEPSGLEPGFTADDLERVTDEENVLASGTLVGTYGR
jgi:Raf kinase inhibitor-like YbhB/YbcL family protein